MEEGDHLTWLVELRDGTQFLIRGAIVMEDNTIFDFQDENDETIMMIPRDVVKYIRDTEDGNWEGFMMMIGEGKPE